jgi:hypothetical protein
MTILAIKILFRVANDLGITSPKTRIRNVMIPVVIFDQQQRLCFFLGKVPGFCFAYGKQSGFRRREKAGQQQ